MSLNYYLFSEICKHLTWKTKIISKIRINLNIKIYKVCIIYTNYYQETNMWRWHLFYILNLLQVGPYLSVCWCRYTGSVNLVALICHRSQDTITKTTTHCTLTTKRRHCQLDHDYTGTGTLQVCYRSVNFKHYKRIVPLSAANYFCTTSSEALCPRWDEPVSIFF